MRYLSVCSGIEAATAAWHPLGWTPVAFSEIDAFPSAVLAHHYPDVPNLGDMTKYQEWPDESVDLLVGGTPCQSFSVAGLRGGLSDPRGGLMLTYLEIARRYRPRWIVWENVPGVLSSNGGRDFGSFLGALGELGYGFAYRVLDAQWFGVAQRRRRVFVVGYLGDWRRAAAVLFKSESVCRDTPPSREKGQEASRGVATGATASSWPADIASTLNAAFGEKQGLEDQHALNGAPLFVPALVGALTAKGPEAMGAPEVDANHYLPVTFGAQMSEPQTDVDLVQTLQAKNPMAVAQPIHYRKSRRAQSTTDHETWVEDDATNTLNCFDVGDVRATDVVAQPVAFTTEQTPKFSSDAALTLTKQSPSGGGQPQCVMTTMQVRRLTPIECERLQGFPDNYTNIPWRKKPESPDGPRYKALGNSMAVPCMAWIGNRINQEDKK